MKEQILGIDIGTSACKVAVFGSGGNVLAQANQAYEVYYPKQGWAEQDADQWWQAICLAIQKVLGADGVSAADICAIGVDGQGWSAIPVDKEGAVLDRTPIWMDTRARDICTHVTEKLGAEAIFQVAGNEFLPSYTTPKMLWFKEERPEVFAKTYKFLQSNSYIVYRLTGVMSQDVSQSYGVHFFDIEKLCYDETMAEQMGLSTALVPELYPCDGIVGTVMHEAAAVTGLKEGTPVVAGGLDAACGALGAGVYQPGQTQEQGGQAGGMSICTDRPLAHRKLILGAHVVPGMWLLQGGTVGGGGALRWFRNEFCRDLSFDEMTEEAARVAAGADGMTFLPYLSGERSPIWNPDAKGVFYGVTFDKSRGHFIRAVLEGVAYSLEHNLQTAAETGVTVDTLNAMGGASNSYLWTQVKADVTGKRIQVPGTDTASTLGAAILAGVGCGLYSGYKEAVERTIHMTRVHEPNPANRESYRIGMERYLRIYRDLEHTFEQY